MSLITFTDTLAFILQVVSSKDLQETSYFFVSLQLACLSTAGKVKNLEWSSQ